MISSFCNSITFPINGRFFLKSLNKLVSNKATKSLMEISASSTSTTCLVDLLWYPTTIWKFIELFEQISHSGDIEFKIKCLKYSQNLDWILLRYMKRYILFLERIDKIFFVGEIDKIFLKSENLQGQEYILKMRTFEFCHEKTELSLTSTLGRSVVCWSCCRPSCGAQSRDFWTHAVALLTRSRNDQGLLTGSENILSTLGQNSCHHVFVSSETTRTASDAIMRSILGLTIARDILSADGASELGGPFG